MKLGLPLAASALLGLVTSADAISRISKTGRYLYSDDGSRFYLKGITYQGQSPGFSDNLADSAGCARDLPNLQHLGANAIRVYSVDSSLNHDACMSALSSAGIYVMYVQSPPRPLNGSIDTVDPAWSTNLLDQYITTINVFSKYDNVLAYNVGNEVVNETFSTAAPYVKAAARDVKAYLSSISSPVLVGYAAKDGNITAISPLAEYLSCDPSGKDSGSTSIDIFGLNNYFRITIPSEWCDPGGDTPPTATYDSLNAAFQNYDVVAYFSEFGSENCNPKVRVWTETGTLFTLPMTNIWSGGLAFNYFFPTIDATGKEYGMVAISPDNTIATPNADFTNLVSQYGKISFVNSPAQSAVTASTFGTCPGETPSLQATEVLPPTPNDAECSCLESKLSCVFTPTTADFTGLLGTLTGEVCGDLGQVKGSCNDIGGNGQSGVYGPVAMCDPTIRLSYAFSQYYELTNDAASACLWSGNAKLIAGVKGPVSAALTTCIPSPSAVSTPTSPAGAPAAAPPPPAESGAAPSASSAGPHSGSASTGAAESKSGAVSLVVERNALVGMAAMAGCVLVGVRMALA
ncbi:1,3-beta-glucanosyltransferase [Mycena galericulata]|nr:1,3-beta-glucanosyltransferase [Mycena galericulata]